MYRNLFSIMFLVVCIFCPTISLAGDLISFPGAEGYGKYTVGGRGGKVYEVTNLNDSGEGSLRAAVEAEGPRTVVFRVGGTITLESALTIRHPFITIAGQTAPGDGICVKGYPLGIRAGEVIIRYMRFRMGGGGDAISSRWQKNIILDHVSASWSNDEVISIYHCENVTIQWSMITEACSGSHRFGGIWGSNPSTYHNNLFAHNTDRNPRFASGSGYNDFRNNVIYNWSRESVYGGEMQQPTRASSAVDLNPTFNFFSGNVVANYFKPGPGTPAGTRTRIVAPWSRNGAADYGKWYIAENYLDGSPEVTADNWKGVFPQYTNVTPVDLEAIPGLRLDEPSKFMPINQRTAIEAYEAVLKYAGCSFPRRDAVDLRIIEEVRTGTASKGKNGFVNNPDMAGGWPELSSGTAPVDSDHDGMPDDWEIANGLDPKNPDDRNKIAPDGFTMLGKYLNSIVEPVKL